MNPLPAFQISFSTSTMCSNKGKHATKRNLEHNKLSTKNESDINRILVLLKPKTKSHNAYFSCFPFYMWALKQQFRAVASK